MKAYKIKVKIERVITVFEDEFREDDILGQDFNEYTATQFAIAEVRDKLASEPGYANTKVVNEYEYVYKNTPLD